MTKQIMKDGASYTIEFKMPESLLKQVEAELNNGQIMEDFLLDTIRERLSPVDEGPPLIIVENDIPKSTIQMTVVRIKLVKAFKENIDAHLQEWMYEDFNTFANTALREHVLELLSNRNQ